MDVIEHYCVYFVIKVQFSCKAVLLWRPKITQKCVYGDEMFCLQYQCNIRQPLTVYCTSISTLPTFELMHHRIKVWWTIHEFYDIRNTQYFVDSSRRTSAKMKNNRHFVV